MASGEALAHGACMRTLIGGAPRREPENELYDRACDLVEAADAIRRLAREPDAVHAVPAVLGCVQDAIGHLNLACAGLEHTAAEAARARGPGGDDRRRVERMHRGFENLSAALEDTLQATRACRALVARALSGEHRRRARG